MKWIPTRRRMEDISSLLWICLLSIIALTGVVLYFRGFDPWTVLLVCMALVCPAVIVWAVMSGAVGGSGARDQSERKKR